MVQDHTPPATKQDITMLMESIGKLYDDTHSFKDDVRAEMADLKNEVVASEKRMKKHMASSITGSEERMKEHVAKAVTGSEKRMKEHMADAVTGSEERIKRHFDVVAEDLRHDVLGANRDEIEGIKDRVVRIERHVGLQTA